MCSKVHTQGDKTAGFDNRRGCIFNLIEGLNLGYLHGEPKIY
jgi:hypothetical protein